MISRFLQHAVDFVWGLPLVLVLGLGGFYLLLMSQGRPLLHFKKAIALILKSKKKSSKSSGQLTHFEALFNALSATVGMGNIAGVAIAITAGGPGAVFWLWVVAFLGMNTKFFECTLALMFREKDHTGQVNGGPMYYMSHTKNKFWRVMAYFFAAAGLLGTLTVFQSNQLAHFANDYLSIEPWVVGVILASLVGYISLGGVIRLARVTSIVTPVMCVLYFIFCLIILGLNVERIPHIFSLIFEQAFQANSAYGGFVGVMLVGVRRALFSNEAGAGTAPMAHSDADTNEPVEEGLVSMIGPFLDTIIICTLTALVILLYQTDPSLNLVNIEKKDGILLTLQAFSHYLPHAGIFFLGISISLFSVTTILGYSNYSSKCWNFLFKEKRFLGRYTFIIFYSVTIFVGSISSTDDVINVLDLGFGLMAFINMTFLIYSAQTVMKEYKRYTQK